MENMIAGILFELSMVVIHKSRIHEETVIVQKCPSEIQIEEFENKYNKREVPGFRAFVKCEQLRGEAM